MNDGTVGWNPGKTQSLYCSRSGAYRLHALPSLPSTTEAQNYSVCSAIFRSIWTRSAARSGVRICPCHASIASSGRWRRLPFAVLHGCCGDVNHIDVRKAFPQKGHEEAARIGTRLAGAVLRSAQFCRLCKEPSSMRPRLGFTSSPSMNRASCLGEGDCGPFAEDATATISRDGGSFSRSRQRSQESGTLQRRGTSLLSRTRTCVGVAPKGRFSFSLELRSKTARHFK